MPYYSKQQKKKKLSIDPQTPIKDEEKISPWTKIYLNYGRMCFGLGKLSSILPDAWFQKQKLKYMFLAFTFIQTSSIKHLSKH